MPKIHKIMPVRVFFALSKGETNKHTVNTNTNKVRLQLGISLKQIGVGVRVRVFVTFVCA